MRPIPSHPTYAATEDGKIFCLRTEAERKASDTDGYLRVWLKNKDGYKQYSVARLVAETYIPNPESKPEVDHINRDRSDNRVENLRWACDSEQSINRAGSGYYSKYIYLESYPGYTGWCIQIKNKKCKVKRRFDSTKYTYVQVKENRDQILREHNLPIID